MQNLKLGFLGVLVLFAVRGSAWEAKEDFELAAVNALDCPTILVSASFTNELIQYMNSTDDHETKVSSKLVLGESLLANYDETMDSSCLDSALSVASNVWVQTVSETNRWYHWQSRLLLFSVFAQENEMGMAYAVASNALDGVQSVNVTSTNLVFAALLRHNRAEGLSLLEAIRLAKSLAAVAVGKREEACRLAESLPTEYRNMIYRAQGNE